MFKKFLVLIVVVATSFSLCCCGKVEDTGQYVGKPFVIIERVPSDWTDLGNYYYEVDTKVVYIGRNPNYSDNMFVKLESEEFEGYVYDLDTDSFVGFNRD